MLCALALAAVAVGAASASAAPVSAASAGASRLHGGALVSVGPPEVTLDKPPTPSNDSTPSFSGTASDTSLVTIDVYAGEHAKGTLVATLKAQGTGGDWASAQVSPPLADGTYTAVATQLNSLDFLEGVSNPVTFEIDTQPPAVTLRAPPSPSNDAAPSFSGTASEATEVTVEVFEGPKPEGRIVAAAHAAPIAGSWISGSAAPALGDGTFTAIATQPSAIDNPAGWSAPVTFVVDTKPPTVTLDPIPSPSGNAAPAFSGTASDHEPVTVQIYEGAHAEGAVVSSASAEVEGGRWASGRARPALQ